MRRQSMRNFLHARANDGSVFAIERHFGDGVVTLLAVVEIQDDELDVRVPNFHPTRRVVMPECQR